MLSQNNSGPVHTTPVTLTWRHITLLFLGVYVLALVFLLLVRGISHELIWDVYHKDALGACGLWVLPNRFEGKIPHMTRWWSCDTSLQKNKCIAKLKTNRYNLNHFSMFESWAAVNVGADKHEAESEERDKQDSRTTLLNWDVFLGNIRFFFFQIPPYFSAMKNMNLK